MLCNNQHLLHQNNLIIRHQHIYLRIFRNSQHLVIRHQNTQLSIRNNQHQTLNQHIYHEFFAIQIHQHICSLRVSKIMINYRYSCFYSDLQIDFDYFENDFIILKNYKIYRNVKLFLQHFKKEVELDIVIINDENVQKLLFEPTKIWIDSKSS